MAGSLGKLLKERRKMKGATLRKVQDETGISNAYLSQVETGQVLEPSPHVLEKLATYYGVEYAALLNLAGYSTKFSSSATLDPAIHFMGEKLTDDEAAAVAAFLRAWRDGKGTKK